mmetsp:Transcript_271/g.371  ORF Transcript_271/g.371 Transcript_271/m.371 type:complete len:83 (-) Transcript_271:432-680(-)
MGTEVISNGEREMKLGSSARVILPLLMTGTCLLVLMGIGREEVWAPAASVSDDDEDKKADEEDECARGVVISEAGGTCMDEV